MSSSPLYSPRTERLANGLTVITQHDPWAAVAAVQLWFHVGSKNDPPGREGFAHMLEHIMFNGSDRIGYADHLKEVFKAGGLDCNAYTTYDQTVYHALIPPEQLDLVLWLEAERLAFLKVDQKALDHERRRIEVERTITGSDPLTRQCLKYRSLQFETHPYRNAPIGQFAHLRTTAVAELREFWEDYYVPNNATLVVVGPLTHEEVMTTARKNLEWIPAREVPPHSSVVEPLPTKPRKHTFTDNEVPLPLVLLSWPTVPSGHTDEPALRLLAQVINVAMRETLNKPRQFLGIKLNDIPQAVFTKCDAFFLEEAGCFQILAMRPHFQFSADQLINCIQKIVDRVRQAPVDADHFTKAHDLLRWDLAIDSCNPQGRALMLGWCGVIEGNSESSNHLWHAIQTLTATDVHQCAQTYLIPQRRLVASYRQSFWGKWFRKSDDKDQPVIAPMEDVPAAPERPGAVRPENHPEKPPLAPISAVPRVTTQVERHVLSNGLTVQLLPEPGYPTIRARLTQMVDPRNSFPRGTIGFPRGTIDRVHQILLDQSGWAFNSKRRQRNDPLPPIESLIITKHDDDFGMIAIDALADHLDAAIDCLANLIDRAEREGFQKTAVQDARARAEVQRATNPGDVEGNATMRLLERTLLGPRHPYTPDPRAKDDAQAHDRLNPQELQTWWQRHGRPGSASLTISGGFNPTATLERVQTQFRFWRGCDSKNANLFANPSLVEPTSTRILLRQGPKNGAAWVAVGRPGLPVDHPDVPKSLAINQYLIGIPNDRLTHTLRYQRGISMGGGGGFRFWRGAGLFMLFTICPAAAAADAVLALFDEIRRLRVEPPNEEEWTWTRARLVSDLLSDTAGPHERGDVIALAQARGLRSDFLDQRMIDFSSMTPEDCVQVARTHLNPNALVVVVTAPPDKTIRKALGRLAPVENA